MGNCIGRKTHLRYKQQQQYNSTFDERDLIIVQYDKQIDNSQENDHQPRRTSGSFETSPSPSFSSLSSHPTSFSSDDRLILSSSSFSSSDQIYLSSKHESTSLPHCKDHLLHTNILSHRYSTLNSIIDDVLQQQSIRIHRQTTNILLEYQPFHCIQSDEFHASDQPSLIFHDETKHVYLTKSADSSALSPFIDHFRQLSPCENYSSVLSSVEFTEYLHSFLIANITYNFMQIFLEKRSTQRHQFGYISSINTHQIQQIIIKKSKLSHSSDLNVHSTKFSLVLRVQSWPKTIRSIYEQRHRIWPTNISSLFQSTCFIRSETSASGTSWSYTYVAIEEELVRLMSKEQKRFASIGWNYFKTISHGQISFAIYKHTLFYFFERYSSNEFQMHDFIEYLLHRYQTKSIPHYFNPNINLFDSNLSFDWLTTSINSPHTSIYTLPNSSLYLSHLLYLIEFQSKFLDDFPSIKNNITQSIFDAHRYALEQISFDHSILQHSFTLDCLYRYQQTNVQIIRDYLPIVRTRESSLLLHVFWSIFIQYFNSLFDEILFLV